MTCEEFIRNNRGINGGENLPHDFLAAVYESISRNEIRITSDGGAQPSPVIWADLGQQSRGARGRMLELSPAGEIVSTNAIPHFVRCDHRFLRYVFPLAL